MAANFFKIKNGVNVVPGASTVSATGDLAVSSTTGRLQYYNGTTGDNVMTATSTDTVANKSIDGGTNTLTNIPSSSLSSNIDATKIANGSVSNTEFQFLDGVTSAIQTQLNAKVSGPVSSTDTAVVRYNGTGGETVQDSGVLINASNAMSGLTQVNVGNLKLAANTINATDTNGSVTVSTSGSGSVAMSGASGSITISPSNMTLSTTGSGGITLSVSGNTLLSASNNLVTVLASNGLTVSNLNIKNQTISNTAAIIIDPVGSLQITKPMQLTQSATPANPDGGTDFLYFKSDDILYQKTAGGVESKVAAGGLTAPTSQKFLATGTQTGWLFTISTSSTVAVGDTYTNNSNTYTVQGALTAQSGQVLYMSNAAATSGATLTRATGAGTSSITFSATMATATYTTPASTLYIKVREVGGGGGGAGSASSANDGGTGASGTVTAFGANLLTANGGTGGSKTAGGTGGANTIGTGPVSLLNLTGGTGSGPTISVAGAACGGGMGANSPLGGAGLGSNTSSGVGQDAITNSGSGAGGAASHGGTVVNGGTGGGAGGYIEARISTPAASYPYLVGGGGAGGSAGTSGSAGGSGGSGYIVVEEYYQ